MTDRTIALGSIENERSRRIRFLRNVDGSTVAEFEQRVKQLDLEKTVRQAWQFARSLDYHHEGLSKDAYLAHPLRVALLYLDLVGDIDPLGLKLALLHNVLEVSGMPPDALARELGRQLAQAIEVLTVDRSQQWDDDYKESYYRRIAESPLFVRQVKVLDKLDNLYILCLNPSDEIRGRYLREIEHWVLPLSRDAIPEISNYISDLVEDNHIVGHIPL